MKLLPKIYRFIPEWAKENRRIIRYLALFGSLFIASGMLFFSVWYGWETLRMYVSADRAKVRAIMLAETYPMSRTLLLQAAIRSFEVGDTSSARHWIEKAYRADQWYAPTLHMKEHIEKMK
jgi:hypothetical protein